MHTAIHPKPDDWGKPVAIATPTTPTPLVKPNDAPLVAWLQA